MTATNDALLTAAITLASVCILGGGLLVAYAARIFRKWRRSDETMTD